MSSAQARIVIANANEAEKAIANLEGIMDQLERAVSDETKYVRAGRLREAVTLDEAKTAVARLYVVESDRIKAAKDAIAQLVPEALHRLRQRHDSFQGLLRTNLTVLATAHAVSEGIMRGVTNELARKSTPAVYGASEGLRTVLVERTATGGQAGQSSRIENYLGFPDGVSGAQLTERARRQALKFGAELLTARAVCGLESAGATRLLHFGDGTAIAAHTVVLATGVSYRLLSAPGLTELTGRGVFYGSAATEAPSCAGSDVYIVGGANSAGQAAIYFARYAGRVHILIRGADLSQSMSQYLIEQIDRTANVEVHPHTEVIGANGDEHLEQLVLCDPRNHETTTVDTSWLFIFIGAEPRTDWLDKAIVRDPKGFVVTGPDLLTDGQRPAGWTLPRDPYHLECSLPGVFAAGDVRSDSLKRVASAVGEGAMAVALVHRYLAAQ